MGWGWVEEKREKERKRGSRIYLRLKDKHQRIFDFLLQKFAYKTDFSESPMFLGEKWIFCQPQNLMVYMCPRDRTHGSSERWRRKWQPTPVFMPG